MFNQYSVYCYLTSSNTDAQKEWIEETLKQIDKMTEYHDVVNKVKDVFGDFNDTLKTFSYPDDIKVGIKRQENLIAVVARKGPRFLCQKRWEYTPEGQ